MFLKYDSILLNGGCDCMQEVSIMVFGDSITYGAVDSEFGGWTNRLRMHLENNKGDYFTLFNLGIPGETTEKLLSRFETECMARYDEDENTIIVFAIGINDTQNIDGNYRVLLKCFERNIKDLIVKAKKFTNKILFIGLTKIDESKLTPVPWSLSKSYFDRKIIEFDKLLENTCIDENIFYLKMYDVLSLNELVDGLHPNSIGHEKLCDVIANKLNDIID